MIETLLSRDALTTHSVKAGKSNAAIASILLAMAGTPTCAMAQTTPDFYETVASRTVTHLFDTAFDAIISTTPVKQTLQPVTAGTLISPAHVGLLQKRLVTTSIDAARYCEGMLYNAKYVITSAACSDFVSPAQVQILVGTLNADGTGVTPQNVARITVHPKWNPQTYEYNVAVWELSSPIAGIPRIPLASSAPPSTGYVQSSSWTYSASGLRTSSILLRSRLALTDRTQCNKIYGGAVTDSMLCAGLVTDSTTACAGDNGGPLYRYTSGLDYELIGINSFGNTTCILDGFFTVYTRISSPTIRNFIISVAGQ